MDLLIPTIAGPHALVRQRLLRRRSRSAPAPTAGDGTPGASPDPGPGRGWRHHLRHLWTHHKRSLIVIALLFIAVPVAWGRINLTALHHWAEQVDPILLFAALVLLPLATVPVTPLNILAGIRFGLLGGLLFVAAAIVCQHLLAFVTVRILPRVLHRKLEPLRARLPRHAHTDATVFTSLIPGAPYWAQLYVLPLVGVPLLTFVILSSALHTIRSLTAVIAGEISDHPSLGWGIALLLYGGALAVTCFVAGRRLTRKYGDQPQSASDVA